MEQIDTVIVGAGQAGIAASRHLHAHGVPHLVLEKARVAEAWRTARWDALVTNGPVWHDRFPDLEFEGDAPDAFVGKERVVRYLEDYAARAEAPIRTGVEVLQARRAAGAPMFDIQTTRGPLAARRIVAATGAFQHPVIPNVVPTDLETTQMHSHAYRAPDQLAPGAVLVVGSGSSGAQIADELNRAGRHVYLSVGPHDRPPRRYRGRDFVWWLGVLGLWDLAAQEPGTEHVTIAVSGAYGGQTMDFRRLAQEGVTLLGMTAGYEEGAMSFAGDLQKNIAQGDATYLGMLDAADRYVARMGLDLPPDPEARTAYPDPESLTSPIRSLDLGLTGISTIIWATGYRRDYGWMQFDAFDDEGAPLHQRGISCEPDVYFLGLPWQSRRGSTFLWGVWHDAKFVADQIAIRRAYEHYGTAPEASPYAAQ